MEPFVLHFKKLGRESVSIAGGKGAQLGEIFNAGIPVPPGFVIVTPAFDLFLKENDLEGEISDLLHSVDVKNTDGIEHISKEIRALISKGKIPKEVAAAALKEFGSLGAKLVAVRSSATAEDASNASWAGELESYMNIEKKDLLSHVKKCWSSLFTPRAIFYRIEKKLRSSSISVAVVVQKMVDSEVSGVAFTVHPVTKNRNHVVIEAGYGLGESVVAGLISPDNYVVDKGENAIIDVLVNRQEKMIAKVGKETKTVAVPSAKQEKQKLDGKKIMALAAICRKIEEHFGSPQDIEWAFEAGKIYVVQTRPITTL